ncbi:MAG TPA: hypothetical protein VFE35_09530 [Candidatus Cybelea sp.]|jgi:hypothetical protein|nr:hypothetical protein [Candidatus Cybelea sp.]
MKTVRFSLGVAALCLIAGAPALSMSQASQVTTQHPIKVMTCNPQRNTYVATGFAPAYYPVGMGPYWGWPSVYGPTYYQYPVQGKPTLSIDYTNVTSEVMKDIEFGLVVHGNLVAEVRDVGTFSPGAEIKHEFGISPNVFPIQTSFARCVALKITFADGSKWKNPHLPALRRSIYGHP